MFVKSKIDLEVKENKEKEKTLYDEYNVGDVLGGFSGYIQYSKPAKGVDGKPGMMANIFGENGNDSDTITALNLTKYQNIPVKITIWGIKNKDGLLLKYKENNVEKFPKICQFIGKIHRPTSSISGLTARFFGEIGGNADAVNDLNKTEFLNSLVFVQVQLAEENALLTEIETEEPDLAEESYKLTPKELKALEKKQKKYEDADNILLLNNFYGNPKVLSAVGTDEEFKTWIEQQECLIDNTKDNVVAYSIVKNPNIYNYVPLTKSNVEKIEKGELKIKLNNVEVIDTYSFLLQFNRKLLIKFVKEKIKEKLNIPSEYFIPPKMLYEWAIKNDLNRLIPVQYTIFFD